MVLKKLFNKEKLKGMLLGSVITVLAFSPLLIFAGSEAITAYLTDIKVLINGTQLASDKKPVIVNGTSMFSIRDIANAFNKNVSWNGETSTITITDKATPKPKPTRTPKPTPIVTPTPILKNISYYNLSDNEINEAIDKGKVSLQEFNTWENVNYSLPKDINSSFSGDVATSKIKTPYSMIANSSFLKNGKFESYTLEQGKKDIDGFVKSQIIAFIIDLKGFDYTFHQVCNFAIKQDDKFITPTVVNGKDELAYYNRYSDSFRKYEAGLSTIFDISKIDFNKKAQLVINYLDEKVYFDIDWNKYK